MKDQCFLEEETLVRVCRKEPEPGSRRCRLAPEHNAGVGKICSPRATEIGRSQVLPMYRLSSEGRVLSGKRNN